MATTLLNGWTVDPGTQSALLQATNFGLRPSTAVAETISRLDGAFTAQTLTGGQPCYTAINLAAGQVVSNVTFWSHSTAAVTPTHQLFGLADSTGKIVATSADALTAAWAANASKTLAMVAPYTVPADGIYYIAIALTAGTLPTLAGVTPVAPMVLATPAVAFSDTANATTMAFIAGAATKSIGFAPLYGYCS